MDRRFNLCLVVTAVFLVILSIVTTTLVLTIFKVKEPNISLGFDGFKIPHNINSTTNMTLGVVITVANPNYGSFKYQRSIGHITYHDAILGSVPIETMLVPAHGKTNLSTFADFMIGKLSKDPNFGSDIMQGRLNLTSTVELYGKGVVLKYIKYKAICYNSCKISVNITSNAIDSNCRSRIKVF